jgi:hypothetical protein
MPSPKSFSAKRKAHNKSPGKAHRNRTRKNSALFQLKRIANNLRNRGMSLKNLLRSTARRQLDF